MWQCAALGGWVAVAAVGAQPSHCHPFHAGQAPAPVSIDDRVISQSESKSSL